jgi:hypothetical protein
MVSSEEHLPKKIPSDHYDIVLSFTGPGRVESEKKKFSKLP